jgi:hypothetical protein
MIMDLWLLGKILVTMLLAGLLLEWLYLLRKFSRQTQRVLFLLLILIEWLSNGGIGLLTSLLCGLVFIKISDQEGPKMPIPSPDYGDGQESTENVIQKQ